MSEKLYEKLASQIADQVHKGVFRPGDRLPSLRRLSRQNAVSISTVLEAYGLLEDNGLVITRPQSGHFVRDTLTAAPPAPAMSAPRVSPTDVNVSQLALDVMRAVSRPGIVHFATAIPAVDFPAVGQLHRLLASVARRKGLQAADYEVPPGNPELRLQIARRAVDAGLTLSPDEIVTTSGCQEALILCLRAVAQAGDTIAIESPAFYGSLQAIESLGMKAIEIPTHPDTGISLDALELAIEQWPIKACMLTPSYSNPLGYCMPDAHRQRLVELLAPHDIPVIEDDIYGDLGYEGPRARAVKSYDRDGRVLLCSSVSKTLEPGLRVGWAAPGRYLGEVEHLKLVTNLATASLPQLAVAEFLERGGYDRHLRTARATYRNRRDRMLHLIGEHFPRGTRATRPDGGFVTWVELPRTVNTMELYRIALEHDISIAPGPLFSPKRKYRNFIRINYARAGDERSDDAVHKLGSLARELM